MVNYGDCWEIIFWVGVYLAAGGGIHLLGRTNDPPRRPLFLSLFHNFLIFLTTWNLFLFSQFCYFSPRVKLNVKDVSGHVYLCNLNCETGESILVSCQTGHQITWKGWKLGFIIWNFQINAKWENQTNAFLEGEAYQFSCFPGSSSSVEKSS